MFGDSKREVWKYLEKAWKKLGGAASFHVKQTMNIGDLPPPAPPLDVGP